MFIWFENTETFHKEKKCLNKPILNDFPIKKIKQQPNKQQPSFTIINEITAWLKYFRHIPCQTVLRTFASKTLKITIKAYTRQMVLKRRKLERWCTKADSRLTNILVWTNHWPQKRTPNKRAKFQFLIEQSNDLLGTTVYCDFNRQKKSKHSDDEEKVKNKQCLS